MRFSHLIARTLAALVLAGCSTSQPLSPTPEALAALYQVNDGPYPLYKDYGAWVGNRVSGLPLSQNDEIIMTARRVALARDPVSPADGPWLHSGCIFDVQRTSPDQQDVSYLWAYGRVVRCDELIATGVPEPQMGMRPRELSIYDGWLGYFPMSLLVPYTGDPPAARQ